MREKINNVFKNVNVNVIITIIAKTITKSNNIIIKILKKNLANDLMKHQHISQPIVKLAKTITNKIWHKILAHGINVRFVMNMHALKMNIEKFNSKMKLANDFKWIFARHLKISFSSVILNINDENKLSIVLHGFN